MSELEESTDLFAKLKVLVNNNLDFETQFDQFKKNVNEDLTKDPFKFWFSLLNHLMNSVKKLPKALKKEIINLIVVTAFDESYDIDDRIIFVYGFWKEELGENKFNMVIEDYRNMFVFPMTHTLGNAWSNISIPLLKQYSSRILYKQTTHNLVGEIREKILPITQKSGIVTEEEKRYFAERKSPDPSMQLFRGWIELGIVVIVIFVGAILIFGIDR